VYDIETWAMIVNGMRLEEAENTMLRWMCRVTLSDGTRTAELMDCLRIVGVEEVLRHERLRLYGHLERKD